MSAAPLHSHERKNTHVRSRSVQVARYSSGYDRRWPNSNGADLGPSHKCYAASSLLTLVSEGFLMSAFCIIVLCVHVVHLKTAVST